jgi:hypothetical protein
MNVGDSGVAAGLTAQDRPFTIGEQMAKRPDHAPENLYTPEQLSEIRRNFALLSTASLQTAYSEALEGAAFRKTAGHQRRSIFRYWCRRGGS